jgi:hypothetical protein
MSSKMSEGAKAAKAAKEPKERRSQIDIVIKMIIKTSLSGSIPATETA